MRIKFKKGYTPEIMAKQLLQIISEENMIIGSVNVYIQGYDDEMKLEGFKRNEEYIECSPGEVTQAEYQKYLLKERRKRIKIVS